MSLKKTYHSVKNKFTDLADISESELDNIEEEIDKYQRKKNTNRIILVNYVAAFSLLLFPIIIIKIPQLFNVTSQYLLLSQGHYSDEYKAITIASLGITCFALLMYFFVMPNDNLRVNKILNINSSEPINMNQSNYVKGYTIAIYLTMGAILYSVQLFDTKVSKWAIIGLKYYIGVPTAFLIFAILIISLAFAIAPLSRKIAKNRTSNDSRIELFSVTLNALHIIDESYHPFNMLPSEFNKAIRALRRASNLIREYPMTLNKLSFNNSVIESFNQSANFIDQIIIDFQTSNNIEATDIKGRLLICLNTILRGNLLDLPKLNLELGILNITRKAKLYHYILLAFYLAIPIIFVISINLVFGIKFAEYEQSLLKILYIVWAFVGIFSNPIILSSDSKELIQDIIKSWLGKA